VNYYYTSLNRNKVLEKMNENLKYFSITYIIEGDKL